MKPKTRIMIKVGIDAVLVVMFIVFLIHDAFQNKLWFVAAWALLLLFNVVELIRDYRRLKRVGETSF